MSGNEELLFTCVSTFPFTGVATVEDLDSALTPGERVLFERLRFRG